MPFQTQTILCFDCLRTYVIIAAGGKIINNLTVYVLTNNKFGTISGIAGGAIKIKNITIDRLRTYYTTVSW